MNPEVAPQEQSEERPRRGWTKVRARKAIGPMAASQTESERRDATRSNLCIPSNAKLKGHAEQIDCQEMITRKIHNRGAFFKTTSPFPLASELRLILALGKHLVRAIGSLVRVDQQGMAVAFTRTKLSG